MLYSHFLRPLLFQLDAERAHELTLRLLRRVPLAWLNRFSSTSSPITLAGLTFPNCVGLAGGLDKNAVAVRAWYGLGFGFVELGTVTPWPQAGNAKPRVKRLIAQRAILNRMGFNNDGAAVVAERLKSLKRPPFPIGVSIGKQSTTPVDDLGAVANDYTICAATLAPVADFLTVNVSSPNTTGLRSLQTTDALTKIVTAALRARPLFVKFAPEVEGDELRAVADAALSAGAAGLIATNTLASTLNGLPCGLSGPPLKDIAPRRIETLRRHVGDGVPLIGVGGIDSPASARRMIDAGADLVQVYTAMVYHGPFLPARLARALRRQS